MKKYLLSVISVVLSVVFLASCAAAPSKGEFENPDIQIPWEKPGDNNMPEGFPQDSENSMVPPGEPEKDDELIISDPNAIVENSFVSTEEQPTSTFSADVDTASYTLFRKMVQNGYSWESLVATAGSSIRTEEMLNYFSYNCPSPAEGALFGVNAAVAPTPWNSETSLLMLTLKAESALPTNGNNLVFLIDVSGSMGSSDKLPLLKLAFHYLVDALDAEDIVSIVTYSGEERLVLSGCPGNEKERILNAINSLTANGATNGESGLRMAYAEAEKHLIEGGNNRIFLASDGDLNVGISSSEELKQFVEARRNSGVYLSVLGFGSGNYKDQNMEALADNGNGKYLYIDGASEAEKVFTTDLFANLYTVAKDVKLQMTFNPAVVSEYRLIGYENRILNNDDYLNDSKDAGELGAGHTVTVFYELKTNENTDGASYADLGIRYKEPDEEMSKEQTFTVSASAYTKNPSEDFRFAAAVVECALLLHNSQYKGTSNLAGLYETLSSLTLEGSRAEFKELIQALIMKK